MATDRTKWVTYTALLGLVTNLVLNHFWIDSFGSIGAAWSTVASLYIVVSVMLPQIAQALNTSVRRLFPIRHLLKVAAATGVSMAIVGLVRFELGTEARLDAALWVLLYGSIGLGLYRILGLPSLGDMVGFLRRRTS